MKEWQELLRYVDQYVYLDGEEEIIIKYGPGAEEAEIAYNKGLEFLVQADRNDNMENRLKQYAENEKWEYDIALDCVRGMSEEDREYVKKHMQTTEYHFGYAMGIRNKYIHPSNKHDYFEADNISSSVMQKIFSILSPIYDYRNRKVVGFYEDFSLSSLMEQYGDSQQELFAEVVSGVIAGDVYDSSEDAIEDLQKRIKLKLGQDEFIRIFKEAREYYKENEASNDREDWYWEVNFPGCKAVLYPLESKQMNVLRKLDLFSEVERGFIKSENECREFIDHNLGLRDDYANFMAKCAWEVYKPE